MELLANTPPLHYLLLLLLLLPNFMLWRRPQHLETWSTSCKPPTLLKLPTWRRYQIRTSTMSKACGIRDHTWSYHQACNASCLMSITASTFQDIWDVIRPLLPSQLFAGGQPFLQMLGNGAELVLSVRKTSRAIKHLLATSDLCPFLPNLGSPSVWTS